MSFHGRNEYAEASCTGKVRFTSHAAARKVMKRRERNRDRHTRDGEVYRCGICRGWHLGRKSEVERPKREWKRFRERYEATE